MSGFRGGAAHGGAAPGSDSRDGFRQGRHVHWRRGLPICRQSGGACAVCLAARGSGLPKPLSEIQLVHLPRRLSYGAESLCSLSDGICRGSGASKEEHKIFDEVVITVR